MKKVNYAAIDIGSNAVRLLIESVNEFLNSVMSLNNLIMMFIMNGLFPGIR